MSTRLCEICESAPAEVYCAKCSIYLCCVNECDQDMHASGGMKNHIRTPISPVLIPAEPTPQESLGKIPEPSLPTSPLVASIAITPAKPVSSVHCELCDDEWAVYSCKDCDMALCPECDADVHVGPTKRHIRQKIGETPPPNLAEAVELPTTTNPRLSSSTLNVPSSLSNIMPANTIASGISPRQSAIFRQSMSQQIPTDTQIPQMQHLSLPTVARRMSVNMSSVAAAGGQPVNSVSSLLPPLSASLSQAHRFDEGPLSMLPTQPSQPQQFLQNGGLGQTGGVFPPNASMGPPDLLMNAVSQQFASGMRQVPGNTEPLPNPSIFAGMFHNPYQMYAASLYNPLMARMYNNPLNFMPNPNNLNPSNNPPHNEASALPPHPQSFSSSSSSSSFSATAPSKDVVSALPTNELIKTLTKLTAAVDALQQQQQQLQQQQLQQPQAQQGQLYKPQPPLQFQERLQPRERESFTRAAPSGRASFQQPVLSRRVSTQEPLLAGRLSLQTSQTVTQQPSMQPEMKAQISQSVQQSLQSLQQTLKHDQQYEDQQQPFLVPKAISADDDRMDPRDSQVFADVCDRLQSFRISCQDAGNIHTGKTRLRDFRQDLRSQRTWAFLEENKKVWALLEEDSDLFSFSENIAFFRSLLDALPSGIPKDMLKTLVELCEYIQQRHAALTYACERIVKYVDMLQMANDRICKICEEWDIRIVIDTHEIRTYSQRVKEWEKSAKYSEKPGNPSFREILLPDLSHITEIQRKSKNASLSAAYILGELEAVTGRIRKSLTFWFQSRDSENEVMMVRDGDCVSEQYLTGEKYFTEPHVVFSTLANWCQKKCQKMLEKCHKINRWAQGSKEKLKYLARCVRDCEEKLRIRMNVYTKNQMKVLKRLQSRNNIPYSSTEHTDDSGDEWRGNEYLETDEYSLSNMFPSKTRGYASGDAYSTHKAFDVPLHIPFRSEADVPDLAITETSQKPGIFSSTDTFSDKSTLSDHVSLSKTRSNNTVKFRDFEDIHDPSPKPRDLGATAFPIFSSSPRNNTPSEEPLPDWMPRLVPKNSAHISTQHDDHDPEEELDMDLPEDATRDWLYDDAIVANLPLKFRE